MTAKEFLEKQEQLKCSVDNAIKIIDKYIEQLSKSYQKSPAFRIEKNEKIDGLGIVDELNKVEAFEDIPKLRRYYQEKGWKISIHEDMVVIGLL